MQLVVQHFVRLASYTREWRLVSGSVCSTDEVETRSSIVKSLCKPPGRSRYSGRDIQSRPAQCSETHSGEDEDNRP